MILTEEVSRRNLQREKETTRAKDREEETGEEMGRPRERSTIVETDSPGAKESQGRVGRTMTRMEHTARSTEQEEGETYRITRKLPASWLWGPSLRPSRRDRHHSPRAGVDQRHGRHAQGRRVQLRHGAAGNRVGIDRVCS